MVHINQLRDQDHKILAIGSYPAIIQSILDFDYLIGKDKPSICAIIAGGRKFERYFFGKQEVLIPVFDSIAHVPSRLQAQITLFLNLSSGRRVLSYSDKALELLNLFGGVIFAEDVPEEHALALYRSANAKDKWIIGPSSVGLLIPGYLKLGAIGGVDYRQLEASRVVSPGNVAIFSASGGMTGELIRIVSQHNKGISFALSFGGDRFPIVPPKDAFLAAQHDEQTEAIIYFGELGGTDEYELAELIETKKITKPVVAYIAGTVSELFDEPPQFGHAKAMAKTKGEGAREKREALKSAGAHVPESFAEFVEMIGALHGNIDKSEKVRHITELEQRKQALITSSLSTDQNGDTKILGEDVLSFAQNNSFAQIVAKMFLGKKTVTSELVDCIDFILRLLADHGPYVSGAVNTIVSARAGKDLPSALATGILTIGPRFGGAINQAASNWLEGVEKEVRASDFVEGFARKREYIAGIGHRKYRVDFPDPRVAEILKFASNLEQQRFTLFAKEVEKVTVSKKGNLILNVDGAIAAVLLDILSEKEDYNYGQLKELISTEFFNALFVLSRSVGFIAHFLDQKRLDEGLLRLPDNLVADISKNTDEQT